MTNNAPEIILHNYPQSPVAEKARVALGIKQLTWRNVEIPRIPPKPLLIPLTGGYRRTPVMQIGADIYCDSQCIIRELERRFPSPTFMPTTDAGLMWCLSRWTDGALFDLSVKIVLGSVYLGADWANKLKLANTQLPHLVAQMRTPLAWLNTNLSDGRNLLLGAEPAAFDAQIYHVVWFLRGRWSDGPLLLSEFAHLERWEKNVVAIGHGTASDLSPQEALSIAKDAESIATSSIAENDPQGLAIGMKVSIGPDVESGEQFVTGIIRSADAETVSIERTADEVGTVCVHFPRTGYRVEV